jgi:hypothetical protein
MSGALLRRCPRSPAVRVEARRFGPVVGLVGLAILAASCGGGTKSSAKATTTSGEPTTAPTTTSAATTTTHPHRRGAPCTLTGALPPSGGKAPERAAIAVKVDNLNQARPQWGLNSADIVFEEPVEGGVTRFVAVYQCEEASRIEPVRSARFVDAQILRPFGKILFAYSGAIRPVVDAIDAPGSLLEDVGAETSGWAYWRDPARVAPFNLATSSALLYRAAAAKNYPEVPPHPYFAYGRVPAGGKAVTALHIYYPLDITTWTWSSSEHLWLRSYACPPGEQAQCLPTDNGPAVLGDTQQISASNVVVLWAHVYPTPYVEDANGAHEVDLTLAGSGPAWVFRDGEELVGKWLRPQLKAPATFVAANGTSITLAPGRTWEELVPWGDRVTVTGALTP